MAAVAAGKRDPWREAATWGFVAASASACFLGFYLLDAFPTGGIFVGSVLDQALNVATGFVFVIIAMIYYRVRAKAPRYSDGGPPMYLFLRGLLTALVLVLVSPLILGTLESIFGRDSFWLPRERLIFNAEHPFTGYVINANEDHLIVMNDDHRILIEKSKADLRDRDFCYPEWYEDEFNEAGQVVPTCP